jgi:hypothetical protein
MDIRTASRTAAATCLVLGPLALAVPVTLSEADLNGAAQLRLTSAHLGTAHLGNVLLLAQILVVPAVIYAARLARRGAPRLAFIGGGLSALAWLAALIGLGATQIVVYDGALLPNPGAIAPLIDKMGADPVVGTLTLLFVLGHVIGMVVLGIALWRSRAVPAWVGILFAAYPLVHLGAHIGGSIAADNVSGVLFVIASVACAVRVLRVRNDDWDLPTTVEPAAVERAAAVPVG